MMFRMKLLEKGVPRSRKVCILAAFIFAAHVLATVSSGQILTKETSSAQASKITFQTKFDPATPLESRVNRPPEEIQQDLQKLPAPSPKLHTLSEMERSEISAVLGKLPDFSRKAIMLHVRSITFVDDFGANGTTGAENPAVPTTFDMALRASLLHENISEFLTRKERNYYSDDPGIRLSIAAGSMPALLYVLLHESVHVLDISNRGGKPGFPQLFPGENSDRFVRGIWENTTTMTTTYQSPLFKMSWFGTRKQQNPELAVDTYRTLAKTPFVSLYGSSNWHDDIAELVTCYYFTQILKQPYRIVVQKNNAVIYSLEPMKNPLVQARFREVVPLYAKQS
ncbi:MAG: hypothetical protein JSS87_01635 [Acidobacteria bacterium]|nr:hypothetical protein [Acidobacteriota bacterium]